MSSVLKKARLSESNGNDDGQPASHSLKSPPTGDVRLELLRESIRKNDISGYLIETQDAHQSEYVADHDKRREWLTGFTGSAGTALVTPTKALLWTDGRYFLQVSRGCMFPNIQTITSYCVHSIPRHIVNLFLLHNDSINTCTSSALCF